MKVSVISFGNARAIKLPKVVLDKYNITDAVELILEKEHLFIKPKTSPRIG